MSSSTAEKPNPLPLDSATYKLRAARRSGWLGKRSLTLLIVFAVLAFAEISARNTWIPTLILPAPSKVWLALNDHLTSSTFWENAWSTVSATVIGFLLAALIGISLAGLLVLIDGFEEVVLPLIIAFEAVPKIAIAPIMVLWLGFGQVGKISIVVLVAFFPILMNAIQGFRLRNRDEFNLMQSLGASRFQLFRYIRFPGSLPYVFAGLRIGSVFALIGAIVAEFVGSSDGLGKLLLLERSVFNVPAYFAVLVELMVIGLAIAGITRALERKIAFWAEDISGTNL